MRYTTRQACDAATKQQGPFNGAPAFVPWFWQRKDSARAVVIHEQGCSDWQGTCVYTRGKACFHAYRFTVTAYDRRMIAALDDAAMVYLHMRGDGSVAVARVVPRR